MVLSEIGKYRACENVLFFVPCALSCSHWIAQQVRTAVEGDSSFQTPAPLFFIYLFFLSCLEIDFAAVHRGCRKCSTFSFFYNSFLLFNLPFLAGRVDKVRRGGRGNVMILVKTFSAVFDSGRCFTGSEYFVEALGREGHLLRICALPFLGCANV
ncbi:hypothetical protein CDAR_95101 [Caerostris darwini]|uniref:Secreted protein n=1 Tax=Caerostris darwini TaxID=1538125 RepID=A0AAV4PM58_9ARAC|nr:hypothetical protein CDAR_95101 [Caerostris darwini]